MSTLDRMGGENGPHVGGEAMSVKAERPLKDVIEATFMEVPRNEAEIPSLGRTMDGPQFGGAREVVRGGCENA